MSILKELKTPIFNAEAIKHIPNRENYKISIKGENIQNSDVYFSDFIESFKIKEVNCRLTSVSGWSVRVSWQGVLWQDFIEYAKPLNYNYVVFVSYGGYSTSVFKEDLENPRIILAIRANNDQIEFDYGGPIRMVIPNLWGYKSCKWLHKITFTDEYVKGYWETYGYEDRGLIKPLRILDINSKKYIDIGYGEVLI
jgi:DMSO/TMAO reductase YedYZ molybdopterin-dependent catalytic subunit